MRMDIVVSSQNEAPQDLDRADLSEREKRLTLQRFDRRGRPIP
jgi:hypothetical protein